MRVRAQPERGKGSRSWRERDRDYVGVAELLLSAGAELEPRFADVADGPLAEWLEARAYASPSQ